MRTRPRSDPSVLVTRTSSPSATPSAFASSADMRTSRRPAPSRKSTSPWIIELNCFPRRVLSRNAPSGMSVSGSPTGVKRALPSGVGKTPPSEARPAILEGVALRCEVLDALVGRDRLGDLPTDGGGVLEVHKPRGARDRAFGEVHEDLPLGPRLSDPPAGDLGGEVHAPFRGRLGAAAALLVPRLGREQEDLLRRLDEHRRREDEVLVDPEGDAAERLPDVIRFR